jgi:predicted Zn finger-like uncharacterized protein
MPSLLKSQCPQCGMVMKITESQVGRRVRCPGCKQSIELSSVHLAPSTPSLEQAPSANDTVEKKAADTSSARLLGTGSAGGSRGTRLGRFELKELLGQGAFGRVYRAYDPQLDRQVALKVPTFGPEDEQKSQRFIAEAKAAARLRHPNIVPTYESGQVDGQYYIAAQFVAGQPLAKRVKEGGVEFRQAAEWVRQLAEGLAYAHRAGIVHRDIKPDNVMLDEHGVPQIMDFGLAKRLNEDSAMTTDGSLIGTPAYMAPEQARGEHKQVGPLSDQYSLGVVLYELLTGKKPFEGSPHSVIAQVIATEPQTLRSRRPDIPEDLEAICQIAMNKTAAERYPSCTELSSDIARWLGGYETHARRLGRWERGWRWCRRNVVVAGMAAAVVLLLTFGLATTGTLVWVVAERGDGGTDLAVEDGRAELGAPRTTSSAMEQPSKSNDAIGTIPVRTSPAATAAPRIVPLTLLNTASQDDAFPWVLDEGRTIYFTREGGQVGNSMIYRASRRDASSPFSSPAPAIEGRHAAVTADEAYLVAVENGLGPRLVEASQSSSSEEWGRLRPIASLIS